MVSGTGQEGRLDMKAVKITVALTEREYKFIEALANMDGFTVKQELETLARLQVREEMELKEAELKGEQ